MSALELASRELGFAALARRSVAVAAPGLSASKSRRAKQGKHLTWLQEAVNRFKAARGPGDTAPLQIFVGIQWDLHDNKNHVLRPLAEAFVHEVSVAHSPLRNSPVAR